MYKRLLREGVSDADCESKAVLTIRPTNTTAIFKISISPLFLMEILRGIRKHFEMLFIMRCSKVPEWRCKCLLSAVDLY
ncbi:hypothetical protein AF72_11100 [Xylella taiwanensis]|uniref:Uncharacterized protein n=1 Tax=Xylella taiwanensis TaxID=1444770 RepID=Z9JHB4_9GAMM|nr:hypothetical protein AB672_00210 [Xylella taiwanensis]EWS77403.1 hypothetical protein AF72_11100 [Xylella taiwanensis]